MPYSCESGQSSTPASVSTLRNFRFQKSKPYSGITSGSTQSQVIDSQLPKKSISSAIQKPVTSTPKGPSTTNYVLSYRNYNSVSSPISLTESICRKIKLATENHNSDPFELKLTPEELKKLKDIVLEDSFLFQKWPNHCNESFVPSSNGEKILQIEHQYSLDIFKCLTKQANPLKTHQKSNQATSVVSNSVSVKLENKEVKPLNSSYLSVNNKVVQVTGEQKQTIMDDYEVFCDKEQKLRKLLDVFPGADIMEAQDILVRCQWNLEKALQSSQKSPPRMKRKRSLDQPITPINSSTVKSPGNAAPSVYPEEIVLDDSDEEVNQVKSISKRHRRIESSESEEENSSSKSSSSVSVQNFNQETALHKKSPETTVSNAGNLSISLPKSVTIKAIPSSVTTNETIKSSPPSNPIPNLPKGLVITQVRSVEANKQTQGDQTAQVSELPKNKVIENGNRKEQVNAQASSEQRANKSAHLIRIKAPNNSVSITPSNISNLNVSSITKTVVNQPIKISNSSVSVSKVVTVIPATKSLSVTPVISSVKTVPNSGITKTSVVEEKQASSKNAIVQQGKKKSDKSKRTKYDDSEEEELEEYGNDDFYDSEDSEYEDAVVTPVHNSVLKFFQEATVEELGSIPGCSKKKIEAIMNVRPFSSWSDLVDKLRNDKTLSTDLLNGAKKVLDMRNAITRLMTKCQQIALDMEDLVENLKENKESNSGYVSKQPELLNDRMHLTPYQMLGLNWLLLLHNQEVNGILADEMGLGKTVQAIAFMAYLKEISFSGPQLIVVPSSTLDNWQKELQTWWPNVRIICYHGQQESRRELRLKILNDEVEDFDVMITTYNMVTSSAEDRCFFKRLEFQYVIFDEAHMLKNMASQRYQHLMRIKAARRILLTGTPLQNNLVELMSLLIFAMPHMFSGKIEQVKQMFTCVSKSGEGNKSSYEKDRIDHAKRIMKPFVLRRLKKDVLQDLPTKHEEIKFCPMSEDQAAKYNELVAKFTAEVEKGSQEKDFTSSGAGMMMQLRRAANHPLLLRRHFDDEKLAEMSELIIKEPSHENAVAKLVFEDMCVMSDFELHRMCKNFKSLKPFILSDEIILNSGKFRYLSTLLPKLIEEDHRILLFSQFTMVLDIIEDFMNIKGYKFLRLDGQVPVHERQQMIDDFNSDPDIPVFLLSTRAGGLGINLTSADTVVLHDIDFNPYNDKQAEDRCHRVGQVRDVRVIRLISENSIEEGILQRAKEKLKLERDIHEENDTEENDVASVAKLLRDALGIKTTKN